MATIYDETLEKSSTDEVYILSLSVPSACREVWSLPYSPT
jgi:hypothetical protein